MKIIDQGRAQSGWSTLTSCTGEGNGGGGCGAKLLVEKSDLYVTSSSARDEITRHITFQCAACGVLTDLLNQPEPVWDGLPQRRPNEWPKIVRATSAAGGKVVMWGGRRMREGKCPPGQPSCLACDRLGAHLEPIEPGDTEYTGDDAG
jgi:hypothetical protein